MSKTIENFMEKADRLEEKTIGEVIKILPTNCLLAISRYCGLQEDRWFNHEITMSSYCRSLIIVQKISDELLRRCCKKLEKSADEIVDMLIGERQS